MPSLLYLLEEQTLRCVGNGFLGKERTEEEPFYGFVVRYKSQWVQRRMIGSVIIYLSEIHRYETHGSIKN